MTTVSDFQTGVTEALSFGQQIRIKYYDIGFGAGSYYDDDISLTQRGTNYWTSGVILPISTTQGSSDAVLTERGKILNNDTKLYIDGRVNTSGTIKIGLGNPVTGEYSLIPIGVQKWDVNATSVLKKIFIRNLPTGSLEGE